MSDTTNATPGQDVLQSARATKVIVDTTFNLLIMGTFPGGECQKVLQSLQFLKEFSNKIEAEIIALAPPASEVDVPAAQAAVAAALDTK